MRQPHQRGLGGALEQVRRQLRVDRVVAHNGMAAIDLDELADALAASESQVSSTAIETREPATDACGSRRTVAPKGLKSRAKATSALFGSFRWLRLDEPLIHRRSRNLLPSALPGDGGETPGSAGRATTFTSSAFFSN
jgi:hypothetical protein